MTFLDGKYCAGCAPLAILCVLTPSISPEMAHAMTDAGDGLLNATLRLLCSASSCKPSRRLSETPMGVYGHSLYRKLNVGVYDASLKSSAKSCCPGKARHVLRLLIRRRELPTFCKMNCYLRLP